MVITTTHLQVPLTQVRKLQQQLREEMELHTVLENAIEKSPTKILSPSCLPHYVCYSFNRFIFFYLGTFYICDQSSEHYWLQISLNQCPSRIIKWPCNFRFRVSVEHTRFILRTCICLLSLGESFSIYNRKKSFIVACHPFHSAIKSMADWICYSAELF